MLKIMQPTNPGYALFLVLITFVFFAIPHRFRWLWLLVISLSFYWAIVPLPMAMVYLAGATLVSFYCGLALKKYNDPQKRKTILAAGVLINIGLLIGVKYLDFFLSQIGLIFDVAMPKLGLRLPPGLSFYIFMTITYMVDVYRMGDPEAGHLAGMEPTRHFGKYFLYVAYFPKILAGPIDRARLFLPRLRDKITFEPARTTEGWQLILQGLIKKMVIADRLAPYVDEVYGSPQFASPIALVMATYLFMIQVYCDFSGYTDMARGAARLVGLDFMINFKRPFLSKSTSEFWGRRWHLTLGNWFRDYMYIPMGGGRVALPRRYFNIMMVFMVSGFWHAGMGSAVNWSFMAWGAVNGFYQWVAVGTKSIWTRLGALFPTAGNNKILTVARILMTFNLIVFSQIWFRASSFSEANMILMRIVDSLHRFPTLWKIYKLSTDVKVAIVFIILLMTWEIFDERKEMWARINAKPLVLRWAIYYALIFVVITMGMWSEAEFIYMQF